MPTHAQKFDFGTILDPRGVQHRSPGDLFGARPPPPGSDRSPTWARFGAETVRRTHFHRSAIVWGRILDKFRWIVKAIFQNFDAVSTSILYFIFLFVLRSPMNK